MQRAALNPNNALIGDLLSVRPAWGIGTRRLTRRYSGPCMNVRRSSDSATRDIYFAGDALDVEAIRSFAGAGGSAFIVTQYDQFSGGVHPTNATNSTQPRILNAGVIETTGERIKRPALRAYAGNNILNIATPPFGTTANFGALYVGHANVLSDWTPWRIELTNRTDTHIGIGSTVFFYFRGVDNSAAFTTVSGRAYQVTHRVSSAESLKTMAINGVTLVSAGTSLSTVPDRVSLFAASGNNDGAIGELMFFNAALPRGDVLLAEANQKLFYGI